MRSQSTNSILALADIRRHRMCNNKKIAFLINYRWSCIQKLHHAATQNLFWFWVSASMCGSDFAATVAGSNSTIATPQMNTSTIHAQVTGWSWFFLFIEMCYCSEFNGKLHFMPVISDKKIENFNCCTD